jgi:hypothetical protein
VYLYISESLLIKQSLLGFLTGNSANVVKPFLLRILNYVLAEEIDPEEPFADTGAGTYH